MTMKCWVCQGDKFKDAGGSYDLSLHVDNFKITDSNYGLTLPRYKCCNCGFIQCNISDVTEYYKQLEDPQYIESTNQRALQFKKLLDLVKNYIPQNGKILDIGAGSGIFVKEALNKGYNVLGLEPALYLVKKAIEDKLPVTHGIFPDNKPAGRFDAIFLTDVIEHIADPLNMLKNLPDSLTENGVVIVTTPNVSSLAASLLGKRWWHYRVAHVGYYNKKTLTHIMDKAGLTPVKWKYAKWYFSSRYISERLAKLLPFISPLTKLAPENLIIPLNLFDS